MQMLLEGLRTEGRVFKEIKGLLGSPIDLQALNLIAWGHISNLVYPSLTCVGLFMLV